MPRSDRRRRGGGRGPTAQAPALRDAVLLGLLQGPAELLPVSSSAHLALIPWLAGWPCAELDPELRKSFEVALHAGAAAAMLVGLRTEVADALGSLDRGRVALLAASVVPPAFAGYALQRPIERRLGGPAPVAAGLLAGAAAMALADGLSAGNRSREDAGAVDGLWLGLAQAAALMPGVSRSGATVVAARARGFGRPGAGALSREVALPVIAGATALMGARIARQKLPPGFGRALATGASSAFASTLAATWLLRRIDRDGPLLPYAAYRTGLALLVIRRLRENGAMGKPGRHPGARRRHRRWNRP